MTEAPFRRVGIVGLGLIGGSIAQGLRQVWPDVRVIGVDQEDIGASAVRRGIVSEARATLGELRDVDLIVLAAPVTEIIALLAAAARLQLGTIVTDVGSTKRHIMRAARTGPVFIGGHPIAGAAHGGLDRSRPDLFQGRPWLLIPADVPEPVVARLEAMVRGLGAIPTRTDAETHDRVMAYVSHLPQLVSNALMNTAGAAVGEAGLAMSGTGFADMTRLAASPVEIWRGILATNGDYIAEAVRALLAMLPTADVDLTDSPQIDRVFRHANEWYGIMRRSS